MAKHWLREAGRPQGVADDVVLAGVRARASLSERWRLFMLRRRIDRMLRTATAPVRHEDARRLPPHILRDIGLQPPL